MMIVMMNQWNPNREELKLLTQSKNSSIICIQETTLLPKDKPVYKNFTIYRQDYTEGLIAPGRVATLIRNDSFVSQNL